MSSALPTVNKALKTQAQEPNPLQHLHAKRDSPLEDGLLYNKTNNRKYCHESRR